MRKQSSLHAPLMPTTTLEKLTADCCQLCSLLRICLPNSIKLLHIYFGPPPDSNIFFFTILIIRTYNKPNKGDANYSTLILPQSLIKQKKIDVSWWKRSTTFLRYSGNTAFYISPVFCPWVKQITDSTRHQLFLSTCCYWEWWHLDSRPS